MKIGVLGTGIVGATIGTKLVELGHSVRMGSRTASNDKAAAWAASAGPLASQGTFADAAAFGSLLFNCTSGKGALEALRAAGADQMRGKILIDISNPLDFSKGMPPTLTVCNTDSLGEQLQREFPEVRIVKTLNTVNCKLMVNPSLVANGDHHLFMSGDDASAKAEVGTILREWFGWRNVIDLGSIATARGTEMLLPLWVELMTCFQSPQFNFKIVR